jgi:hypothetical protein
METEEEDEEEEKELRRTSRLKIFFELFCFYSLVLHDF